MKKTCNGCRALERWGCTLQHKTKVTLYSLNGFQHDRKPLEECEKPRTYSHFFNLLQNKRNKK
tara:strand:- start:26 stop:214 length:189 start_codon:yes stop_codon:yes gene_type:complete